MGFKLPWKISISLENIKNSKQFGALLLLPFEGIVQLSDSIDLCEIEMIFTFPDTA